MGCSHNFDIRPHDAGITQTLSSICQSYIYRSVMHDLVRLQLQYFFMATLSLPTPLAISSLAPLADVPAPVVSTATLGGVNAQAPWGYSVSPAAATITITSPSAGAAVFLDQWSPVSWTTTGFASKHAVVVELYYMKGLNDPAVSNIRRRDHAMLRCSYPSPFLACRLTPLLAACMRRPP